MIFFQFVVLTLLFSVEWAPDNLEFDCEVSIIWQKIVLPKNQTRVLQTIRLLLELIINHLSLIVWLCA